MIRKTDPEDVKRRFAHRRARAPEEGQSAALGVDVPRRIPGDDAIVRPLNGAGAPDACWNYLHLVLKVGDGVAGGHVGSEALVRRESEQELRRIRAGTCGAT